MSLHIQCEMCLCFIYWPEMAFKYPSHNHSTCILIILLYFQDAASTTEEDDTDDTDEEELENLASYLYKKASGTRRSLQL